MAHFHTEPRVAVAPIGAVDASASPEHNVFIAPTACRITGVSLVCGDEITEHTTNYGDQTVTNVTDSETVATMTQEAGEADVNAITTDTEEQFTLASTASNLELDDGDILQIAFTENSAAEGDLTQCTVFVEYIPGTGSGN